ncbi:hypothetical protein TIFTF001_025356 [Ficus carica]|uniref:Uncharacterized protein n=1 Tax=Ficus carica TaxID=3494 RepID=A0AA88AR15_FICCA|nr:hypothetical protein TIFTF001_025356 [Ficus carica]
MGIPSAFLFSRSRTNRHLRLDSPFSSPLTTSPQIALRRPLGRGMIVVTASLFGSLYFLLLVIPVREIVRSCNVCRVITYNDHWEGHPTRAEDHQLVFLGPWCGLFFFFGYGLEQDDRRFGLWRFAGISLATPSVGAGDSLFFREITSGRSWLWCAKIAPCLSKGGE